jgi:hypothetical protein
LLPFSRGIRRGRRIRNRSRFADRVLHHVLVEVWVGCDFVCLPRIDAGRYLVAKAMRGSGSNPNLYDQASLEPGVNPW